MRTFTTWVLALGLGIAVTSVMGCSDSSFSGATGSSKAQKNKKDKNSGDDADDGDDPDDEAEGEGNEGGNGSGEGNGVDEGGFGETDSGVLEDGRIRQKFTGEGETEKVPLDIVFAMDTSGSMNNEKASLQSAMTTFVAAFETKAKKTDYQLYMIGQNFQFPAGTDGKITKIEKKIDSNNALVVLKMFFSGELQNPKPLREDSRKQIVVVTDDTATKVKAPEFKAFLEATPMLKDKTSFNGIVGLPTTKQGGGCSITKPGLEYVTLGADPVYGGLIQDICDTDWEKLLDELAAKIIKQNFRGEFELARPANGDKPFEVKVDGDAIDESDYSFDQEKNAIIFEDTAKPGDGAKIEVIYWPK
jgi:hypothetical protein